MPANKNAMTRYKILDELLSSRYHNYSLDDLTEEVSNRFHWSANEIRTSKIRTDHYFLYLVDYEKISEYGYEPIIIQNPSAYFVANEDWNITPDS